VREVLRLHDVPRHRAGGFASLPPSTEEEDDLSTAHGTDALSRLSCQAIVRGHEARRRIPRYTINQVKEGNEENEGQTRISPGK